MCSHLKSRTTGRQGHSPGELDYGDAQDLLDETLDEESNVDKLLTKSAARRVAQVGINERANR